MIPGIRFYVLATLPVQHAEQVAEILNTFGTAKRVTVFFKMCEGEKPLDIADELDMSRQGIQRYIKTWKEAELMYSDGNDYIITKKGEKTRNWLENLGFQLD